MLLDNESVNAFRDKRSDCRHPVASPATLISLVTPCYNEEEAIPIFYEEAVKVLTVIGGQSELIFVDDGSKDGTITVLRQLASLDNRVHYLSLSRNFGKEAAILAGLQAATGEYIVIIDADGQDPPSLIPKMLECVTSREYDCAATRRVNRLGEPPIRSFSARCFYSLMKIITDIEIVDGARDFRLMNKKYLDALLELSERNRFLKGIFPWLGFKTKWFEYENIERKGGKTKWSFGKLFLYSLDGIIAFSSKPLTVASILGILLCITAVSSIIYVVVRKLIWNDSVGGWASMICIILFCSGIQLFTTGVLGQYMAKTYTEVKRRPHYLIREKSKNLEIS